MTRRQRRLGVILIALVLVSAAVALLLSSMRSGIVFFFTPSEVDRGAAPHSRPFRVGGLVRAGSVSREAGSLSVHFVVTDTMSDVRVAYTGMLPDLFREGRGVVAQGLLGANGVFMATQVLAKHDENYVPPEAKQALERARESTAAKEMRQ